MKEPMRELQKLKEIEDGLSRRTVEASKCAISGNKEVLS